MKNLRHVRLDNWLQSLVDDDRVDGAGLIIAVGGETVYERYAGKANESHLASAETLWPLASISKVYAAATAMSLVEQGTLTLQTRINSIVPELTGDNREQITLRHLLTHTSGIPYESDAMPQLMEMQTPFAEIVADAWSLPVQFSPGTNHLYSDLGVALVRPVVERITGSPFARLFDSLVGDPGGLLNTWFHPPNSVYPSVAYIRGALAEGTDGAMYNSQYGRQLAHPALGVIAPLPDVLRFLHFFTPDGNDRLLSGAIVRAMTTDQTSGDESFRSNNPQLPTTLPYGLGFAVKSDSWTPELSSPSGFGHGGASGCIAWVDPAYDLAFAFVSNRHWNASQDEFGPRLMAASNLAYSLVT